MNYKWNIIISLLFFVSTAWATPITEQTLARKVQAVVAPMSHFKHMRFYPPVDRVYQTPGLWERWVETDTAREHERALAFYLFNMYVISRTYHRAVTQISLNELGVLDAFALCHRPFDFKNATSFLEKHQAQVDQWMTQFIKERKLSGSVPTKQEYQAWARLLETMSVQQAQGAYAFAQRLELQAPLPKALALYLGTFLQQALVEGKTKAVLYDKPDLKLEDLDRKVGNTQLRRKRTYRWAWQECSAYSYLIGKFLSQDLTQQQASRKNWRIYTLTAWPKRGEFLKPAVGASFKMASGEDGSYWHYHTAVLVVASYENTYVPVILDGLLGGTQAMTLKQWTLQFSPNTVFTAVPFRQDETTEQAFKSPDAITGQHIWVKGKEYLSAPILQ